MPDINQETRLKNYSQGSTRELVPQKDRNSYSDQTNFRPPLQRKVVPTITLHQSIFLIITKFIVIEFLFDFVYFLSRFMLTTVPILSAIQSTFSLSYTVIFIVLNIIKLGTFIFIGISWVTNAWEIRQGEIIFRAGILLRREKVYLFSNTQEVICSQGIFERMFNFGTIEIHNPAIKEKIILQSIQNPRKYTKVIKEYMATDARDNYFIYEI